jgi:Fe-S-cluster containining protein
MSACLACPRPGECCKGFALSTAAGAVTFWKHEGIGGPLAYVAQHGLPFVPIKPHANDWRDHNTGFLYDSWHWGCSNLLPDGRCGDYPNRPKVCRDYTPLQDRMCALYPENLLEHRA